MKEPVQDLLRAKQAEGEGNKRDAQVNRFRSQFMRSRWHVASLPKSPSTTDSFRHYPKGIEFIASDAAARQITARNCSITRSTGWSSTSVSAWRRARQRIISVPARGHSRRRDQERRRDQDRSPWRNPDASGALCRIDRESSTREQPLSRKL
jgi:hypothetical protein